MIGWKAMSAPRLAPVVFLLVLVGAGTGSAGCSDGTTPVCDDAGSCLIVPPSGDDGGTPEAAGPNDGEGGGGGGGEAGGDGAAE